MQQTLLKQKLLKNLSKILTSLILLAFVGFFSVSYIKTNANIDVKNIVPKNKVRLTMNNMWQNYKASYMKPTGQIVDPTNNITTSEAQSYALLKAVIIKDRIGFDKIYNWTKANLQVRPNDKLFSWKATLNPITNINTLESENATDGDLDIAISLFRAHELWRTSNTSTYLAEAMAIIKDIFKHRVKEYDGKLMLLPYNSQSWKGIEVLNPSYFSPGHYQLFSEYDTSNNWLKLRNDTYTLYSKIRSSVGLYPDWVIYDIGQKVFRDSQSEAGVGAHRYGYDAFRVFWRVSQDKKNPKSKEIMKFSSSFFEKEYISKSTIVAVYDTDGRAFAGYSDIATISGAYFAMSATNSNTYIGLTKDIYTNKINVDTATFEQDLNYYSENWTWFVLADIINIDNITKN
jgi:endo-1,4-beta-D-glucanase Y